MAASRARDAKSPQSRGSGDEDNEYDDDGFEASDAAEVLRRSHGSARGGSGGPGAPIPSGDPTMRPEVEDAEGATLHIRRSRQGLKVLGVSDSGPVGVNTGPVRASVLGKLPGSDAPVNPRVSAIDLSAFVSTMRAQKKMRKEKKSVWRQKRIDELAVPFDRKPRAKFSSEEDAKNCKFTPKIGKKSREMVAASGGGAMFLIRMESKEQARRSGIEHAVGEKAYNARHDRKVCPDCGQYQTYSEWKANIKRCQNERCSGRLFRPRLAWGDVQTDFLTRLNETQAQKEAKLEEAMKKSTPQFRMAKKVVFDPATGKPKEVATKPKNWAEVRADFLKRNEDDLARRQENMRRLNTEGLASNPMYAECTFQPKLNSRRQPKEAGSFEERMMRDLENRRRKKEKTEKLFASKPTFAKRPASARRGKAKRAAGGGARRRASVSGAGTGSQSARDD
uniref:Uncharacterized protein n=1 Tax=Bicosoecida sp. CB-2014 TaxID=1486930 RepID=A0A7S1GBD2_9STRA